MNLQEKVKSIKELETFETPWSFARIFGKVQLFGSQISICSQGNNDFVEFNEFQEAVEWLVNELGGKVKWNK